MTEDPRLLWLGAILLGLLILSVGELRRRFIASVQALLIWVLIFAGLVWVYAERDVLIGALVPSARVEVEGGRILIHQSVNGHFYLTLDVNGVPIDFIVDTGATDVVLSAQDARRVGIAPGQLRFSGRAATANGEVRTARIRLARMELGPMIDRNVVASVTSGEMSGSLLGMSYLDRFDIRIRDGRMTLTR